MVRREQSSKEVEISFTSRIGIFYRLLSVSSWTSPSVSSGLCLGEGGKVHFKRTSEWRSRPKKQGRCTTSLPSWCKFCSFHTYFFWDPYGLLFCYCCSWVSEQMTESADMYECLCVYTAYMCNYFFYFLLQICIIDILSFLLLLNLHHFNLHKYFPHCQFRFISIS